MPEYYKLDLQSWPRREHYRYFSEKLKVELSMTVGLDVGELLAFCHHRGVRFYPALIWLVTKTVNGIENMRMFRDAAGELCVWERVVPNYTIFHADDNTFSDCWSEYSENFDVCYQTLTADMERYKDTKGIKAREGQPENFYCVSCVPWTHFSSCFSRVTGGEPQLFPVVTAGRYERENGALLMPVNLTIAHAVCDGYHAGLFFSLLQAEMNALARTR